MFHPYMQKWHSKIFHLKFSCHTKIFHGKDTQSAHLNGFKWPTIWLTLHLIHDIESWSKMVQTSIRTVCNVILLTLRPRFMRVISSPFEGLLLFVFILKSNFTMFCAHFLPFVLVSGNPNNDKSAFFILKMHLKGVRVSYISLWGS